MAYHLAEAELQFVATLPGFLSIHAPHWPVAETIGLDVGASMGVYSLAMRRWCKHVHAFEPNPDLAKHLEALQLSGLTVHAAAAGNTRGEAHLIDTQGGGWRHPEARVAYTTSSAAWQRPCSVVRLEDVVSPARAMVVKIDVEGTEADVLAGMGHLLDTRHLMLIVEIEARHTTRPQAVFEKAKDCGLLAFQMIGGKLVAAGPETVLANASRTGGRFARLRGYRNNFIFLKSSP